MIERRRSNMFINKLWILWMLLSFFFFLSEGHKYIFQNYCGQIVSFLRVPNGSIKVLSEGFLRYTINVVEILMIICVITNYALMLHNFFPDCIPCSFVYNTQSSTVRHYTQSGVAKSRLIKIRTKFAL